MITVTKTKTKQQQLVKQPPAQSSTPVREFRQINRALEIPKFTGPIISVPEKLQTKKNEKIEFSTSSDNIHKKQKTFSLESLDKSFHLCNQSGYRSLKDLETKITGQECSKLEVSTKPLEKKVGPLDYENINKWKNTFRSGYQHEAPQNPTGAESLLLMGVKDPHPIKPGSIYGDSNKANGWNGWAKNELYFANYLNSEGVGKRPK